MTVAGGRRNNPYIIGRPIEEPELFFGREALFGFIEDHLSQNVKVILLHGQRRIGKSSVLKQIHLYFSQRVPQEFVFVNYDLQDKAQQSLGQVLRSMAEEIVEQLEHLDLIVDKNEILNSTSNLEDLNRFSQIFFKKIFSILNNQKLVLLLDEFDVLSEENTQSGEREQAGISFFSYLKNLINEHEKLVIIPVIGRNLDDKSNLLKLFGRALVQEIGLLDELSAQRLMINPAQNQLRYESDALKAILELSAGHPYFTQVICFVLFQQARENNRWSVTREDVAEIVEKAIECAEAGLDWYWRGLPTHEQVVFCAVAEAQRIAILKNQRVPEEPLTLLKSYGVVQTEPLVAAYEKLVSHENRFLDNTGRRMEVELVRLWLLKKHPLRDAIWQLETIDKQEVNSFLQQAHRLETRSKTQEAIALYEQILQINPNNFSIVEVLAQLYVATEKFDQAVELYTRAYQFDPVRHQDELLRALQSYGERLVSQRAFTQARKQYLRILEIDPDNNQAQNKLIEFERLAIEIAENLPAYQSSGFLSVVPNTPWWRRRVLVGSIAVGICAVVLSVAGYRQASTPCAAGQQKSSFIFCVPDQRMVSRGDRTFFPNIRNPERDRGIVAFEQGKYTEAAEFFKKALAAKPKDPEVMIYYNNARAKQQGFPLTLAVVVPADHIDKAREILRGVAQAQNQLNEIGGLNGRLLEIVLANDDNNPEKARQIARELINNSSVLGVIGHTSSDVTNAALPEYEQAKLAIISPTSTNPFLRSSVFFRTIPSDAASGKKLAEYTRKSLGLNKVVIFFVFDSLYSNRLREEFTKNFQLLGGQVVRNLDLTDPHLDAEKEILRSLVINKSQAPTLVLFPDTEHISVALQIAKVNADLISSFKDLNRQGLKLLGGDALYSGKTLEQGGNTVEGLILAVPWFRNTPQSKNFAQAAAQQWGGPISWPTATSFDATQAFIEALSSSNPSRLTVLQRLRQLNLPLSKTSGNVVRFIEGETQTKPILVRIVGGKFEPIKEQR